jgi:hypothetical protein
MPAPAPVIKAALFFKRSMNRRVAARLAMTKLCRPHAKPVAAPQG